ncbi:MAG: hypothetical protein Q4P24_15550 [Rhodobacterales bacterium]|nr:hypothetical protein [Rhodobacterales bacterium]
MVEISTKLLPPDVVAHLCVENWKLTGAMRKAIDILPDADGRRLTGQLNFSIRQLSMLVDKLGFKLVEFDGEAFHTGLAASADNAEDYAEDVKLVVVKTLEPTVMADMKIIRLGRVLVEPVDSGKE